MYGMVLETSTAVILSAFLLTPTAASREPNDQRLLTNHTSPADKIIKALKHASVIPEVIETFTPDYTLNATWYHGNDAGLGQTLDPRDLSRPPDIYMSSTGPGHQGKLPANLVLGLTDPDAPSRDNPEWSEICHWILYIHHTKEKLSDGASPPRSAVAADDRLTASPHAASSKILTQIETYKAPGPPPKTGKHRYVFLVLVPKNGTEEMLTLSKPGDRKHWGYKDQGNGIKQWSKDNDLVVKGADYFYAQNEEQ